MLGYPYVLCHQPSENAANDKSGMGWVRDLTRDGIEPNPGPHCRARGKRILSRLDSAKATLSPSCRRLDSLAVINVVGRVDSQCDHLEWKTLTTYLRSSLPTTLKTTDRSLLSDPAHSGHWSHRPGVQHSRSDLCTQCSHGRDFTCPSSYCFLASGGRKLAYCAGSPSFCRILS